MERRSFIKLGIGSAVGLWLANVGVTLSAPADSVPVFEVTSVKGPVTFNAGWVINLEDRNALLELEKSKNKALEVKNSSQNNAAPTAEQKPAKKSVTEKVQDWLNKAKSWF